MPSCGSFVGQARLQFAGLHSLFLALWCTVIEIGGAMMDLLFWDLRILLIEILHSQLALSITCGYTSSKFCIFNSPISIISDISPISFEFYLLHNLSQYITYKKLI